MLRPSNTHKYFVIIIHGECASWSKWIQFRYPAVTATGRRLCEMCVCEQMNSEKKGYPKTPTENLFSFFFVVSSSFSFSCCAMPCHAVQWKRWVFATLQCVELSIFIRHSPFRLCVLFLWVSILYYTMHATKWCARGSFSWTAFGRNYRHLSKAYKH